MISAAEPSTVFAKETAVSPRMSAVMTASRAGRDEATRRPTGALRDHPRLLGFARAGQIVFGQGLGDLFVIRVAGNIVAPSQIGSVEFAAEQFGTRLVVVLGHSRCGAIQATLEELRRPRENQSRNLKSIVDRVRPSVEPLLHTDLVHSPQELVAEAVRANVRASASHLRAGSAILEHLILNDGLRVVGAEYSLDTSVVDFFDDL